jgi:ribosome-binding protein aMBF1 (putative translation factor)
VSNTERVAKQIVALRGERRLSQETLAAKAGINRVTLARIELAVHQPTLDTLDALARALGVRLVDLIEPKPKRRRWWRSRCGSAMGRGGLLVDHKGQRKTKRVGVGAAAKKAAQGRGPWE